MLPQKHLKDLLLEDQEPFHLPTFIADRCCRPKKLPPPPKPQLPQHLTKPNPNLFPSNPSFCGDPCFFSTSTHSSPHTRISPPTASSVGISRFPNGIFLNSPSTLLEAATRVQKQGSKSRPQSQNTDLGFGLLRSVLRRLKIGENGVGKAEAAETRVFSGMEEAVNLDSSSRSSGFRKEDEEEDDDDGGGCGCGLLFEEVESVKLGRVDGESECCLSSFRLALQSGAGDSPCSGSPATENHVEGACVLLVPRAASFWQETSSREHESTVRIQVEGYREDKDQKSPVSVLEPPFKTTTDTEQGKRIIIRSVSAAAMILNAAAMYLYKDDFAGSKKLLKQLNRLEKLAKLDPVKLEKRFFIDDEQGDDDDDDESIGLEEEDVEESKASLLKDLLFRQSGYHNLQKPGMKRLISHLIFKEVEDEEEEEEWMRRTVKRLDGGIEGRLEAWEETVKPTTIEMIVNMELRSESHDLRKLPEQVTQVALDIEVDIFIVLVEEMVEEISFELIM